MRIGLVCPYDMGKPGGVQAQVSGLAVRLVEESDDVVVIAPGAAGAGELVNLGSTVTIPGNASMVPISLDPRVVSRIEQAARNVDLLHVHEPLMPLVSLAALRAGKPVVGTFHAAPGSWGRGLYRVLGARLRRILGPNIARITAVSGTAAGLLPDDLDVEVIPNGVDVSAFSLDVDRNPLRVCFLGRDEKRKGLDVLLRAWPHVDAEVPGAELVVMGSDRGLPGIDWKGRVDDATKAEVLSSSALFVAPHLGGESFGIVLIEAMAAGTPVLASDLPAFRDVAGDAAHHFATGDSEELAGSIVDLLQNEPARAGMTANGRARARVFDWKRVTASYRSTYELALS